VGPFGSLDVVGLDTVWHIIQANSAAADAPEHDPRARLIKDYVDKGWLGVKSGRGFYAYPDPAYGRPEFLRGEA
jgi:3-hydroxybutyryl-CoA dehydrogenase